MGEEAKKFKEELRKNPAFAKMEGLGVTFHFTERTREYYNQGFYAQNRGNFEEAIRYYKEAIELTPGHFKAYNNIGNCYNSLGKLNEGLAAHKMATEVNPEDAVSWESLGISQKGMGEREDAVKSFSKALELSFPPAPFYLKVTYRRANLLTECRHYEEALRDYDTLVKHIDHIADPENIYSERQAVLDKLAEKEKLTKSEKKGDAAAEQAKAAEVELLKQQLEEAQAKIERLEATNQQLMAGPVSSLSGSSSSSSSMTLPPVALPDSGASVNVSSTMPKAAFFQPPIVAPSTQQNAQPTTQDAVEDIERDAQMEL